MEAMKTVSAKSAGEIAGKPPSVIYDWATRYAIGERDEAGKLRIDVVGLSLKMADRIEDLRRYTSGKMSAGEVEELRSAAGIGGAFIGTVGASRVPLLVEADRIEVPVLLRAALFQDADRSGLTPVEVLLACYAADLSRRGIV